MVIHVSHSLISYHLGLVWSVRDFPRECRTHKLITTYLRALTALCLRNSSSFVVHWGRDWSGSGHGVSPPCSTGSPGLKLSDITVLVPNRVMVATKVDCHVSADGLLAPRQGVSVPQKQHHIQQHSMCIQSNSTQQYVLQCVLQIFLSSCISYKQPICSLCTFLTLSSNESTCWVSELQKSLFVEWSPWPWWSIVLSPSSSFSNISTGDMSDTLFPGPVCSHTFTSWMVLLVGLEEEVFVTYLYSIPPSKFFTSSDSLSLYLRADSGLRVISTQRQIEFSAGMPLDPKLFRIWLPRFSIRLQWVLTLSGGLKERFYGRTWLISSTCSHE